MNWILSKSFALASTVFGRTLAKSFVTTLAWITLLYLSHHSLHIDRRSTTSSSTMYQASSLHPKPGHTTTFITLVFQKTLRKASSTSHDLRFFLFLCSLAKTLATSEKPPTTSCEIFEVLPSTPSQPLLIPSAALFEISRSRPFRVLETWRSTDLPFPLESTGMGFWQRGSAY